MSESHDEIAQSEYFLNLPRKRMGAGLIFVDEQIDSSQIVLPPDELISWKWCDPDDVAERLSGFMARRLDAALLALSNGTVAELENGHPVGSN